MRFLRPELVGACRKERTFAETLSIIIITHFDWYFTDDNFF
jgi:hypothetical protein